MATVTTWLFIDSEQHTVDLMSARIGVACDRSWWNKDDPRGKTGKTFRTNGWRLGCGHVNESSDDLETQIKASLWDILSRLSGYEERFRSVAVGEISGLLLGICAETPPAIVIDQATLTGIGALGWIWRSILSSRGMTDGMKLVFLRQARPSGFSTFLAPRLS